MRGKRKVNKAYIIQSFNGLTLIVIMYRTTYFVLSLSIIVSFLFFWISPLLKKLDIKSIIPVVLYPANILAVLRVVILILSVKLSIPVGKLRLSCFGKKKNMVENKDKSNQRSHNVFYAFLDGEKKKTQMFAGPTISICWLVSALLDDMDGSIARGTDTTSQLGEALDHKILDPLGAWMALLAARWEDETVEGFLLLLFSQNLKLSVRVIK